MTFEDEIDPNDCRLTELNNLEHLDINLKLKKVIAMVELASQTSQLLSEISASNEDALAILAKDYIDLSEEIRVGLRPYLDKMVDFPQTITSNSSEKERNLTQLNSIKTDIMLELVSDILE